MNHAQADEPTAQGETVLVVEDELLVRELTVEMLAELGYAAVAAENGREALEVLEKTPKVDLLLTDVVLPLGMSGADIAELAQRLRPGIKVLFMSGYTRDILAQQGRLRGDVHLINKPFSLAALAVKLREALD